MKGVNGKWDAKFQGSKNTIAKSLLTVGENGSRLYKKYNSLAKKLG